MPIRPENRGYPTPLTDVLLPAEYEAVIAMRQSLGVDPMRFYDTWERIIARHLDGELTPARHPWDITTAAGARVEVKFSYELHMMFRVGRRDVFRFNGLRTAVESDVLVLIGLDRDDDTHLWIAPSGIARGKCCTLQNPKCAIGNSRSKFARYLVPFDALISRTHEYMRANETRRTPTTTRQPGYLTYDHIDDQEASHGARNR
ncbi:hypothetical protein [Mycolicibacterium fortuitum]|uniref:hypothetical protein n=1 Tax=Mycolicibacterium fortuitum TaxID=1766 RepID=UPI0010550768|nr:hypothetical protein [Mycolicibacterium fortuitum]